MRILLVHPKDSALLGPWSEQHWDLVVDLGRSSEFSRHAWRDQYGCEVLSLNSFREGIADAREVRRIFREGRSYLVDEKGIDHWELEAANLFGDALSAVAMLRVARELLPSAEFWSTRPDWQAECLGSILKQSVHYFHAGLKRAGSLAARYANLLQRLSRAQIQEIFWDKYDPGYHWRRRWASKEKPAPAAVFLIPSAYENVSRVAAAYAKQLPSQSFLLVATRQSAKRLSAPTNIKIRDLAMYATNHGRASETTLLQRRWAELKVKLQSSELFRVLLQAGILEQVTEWLGHGLAVRDAWSEVLDREPVEGVLCGDDSNLFTRLPVMLASARKIPTVDFHHGALDGNYLVKDLPSDVFLAKSEMERDYLLRVCELPAERVVVAAPAGRSHVKTKSSEKLVVLFSEPYEVGGMRAEEVYRELLPSLWRLAQENGRELVVKLHPFESRSERNRIIRDVLTPDVARQVTVVEGPRAGELISQAWFGITIESTTSMECLQNGVCCFLCGWLTLSSYGYSEQFARFGIGEVLKSAGQIEEIPERLAEFSVRRMDLKFPPAVEPALLQQWLTGMHEASSARSAS